MVLTELFPLYCEFHHELVARRISSLVLWSLLKSLSCLLFKYRILNPFSLYPTIIPRINVIPPNIRALLPETLPVSDIFLNYSWEITLNIKEALDEWTRYSVIKWFVCICHFEENLIKLIWGQPFLLFHPFFPYSTCSSPYIHTIVWQEQLAWPVLYSNLSKYIPTNV